MKENLKAFLVTCMVTVLTTSVFVGDGCRNALAAETGTVKKIASSDIEKNRYEMPIVSIDTITGSDVNSNEDYIVGQISIINNKGSYEMAKKPMSIRLRGNSSGYANKKSYKIKFEDKQDLLKLGNGKGKTWSLIANHYDGSLIRNLAVYRFADLFSGISYSPDCRSVEVNLNGEYQGVYLLCEDINISKNRIAIKEEPDEVENNGYLMEMSRYDEANKFDVDTASYIIKSDLSETKTIKEKQISYISGYTQKAYDAIKNGNQEEVEKYININSFVDIYIVNEIVKNIDVGWDSFYMYKDAGEKLCYGPMWDFDLAMGNANCVKGFDSWAGLNPYHILNVNANSNPWFCHALTHKWFRELVVKRWKSLQEQIDSLPGTITKEAQDNYKSYCRNYEKWNILGKQVYIEPEQIMVLPTFKDHYTYLDNWLANRVKWLTKYYSSTDFIKGVFVDEGGNPFSESSNMLKVSVIIAVASSPTVDMTYQVTPNIGTTISIQKGGVENWHTQAISSGFMLEEGKEYVLSFDYKCSAERPLSFAIQQNYGAFSPYYTGNLTIMDKMQHYECTFTAPKNDSNCALVFNLGGDTFNGTAVTIDNMCLVKK